MRCGRSLSHAGVVLWPRSAMGVLRMTEAATANRTAQSSADALSLRDPGWCRRNALWLVMVGWLLLGVAADFFVQGQLLVAFEEVTARQLRSICDQQADLLRHGHQDAGQVTVAKADSFLATSDAELEALLFDRHARLVGPAGAVPQGTGDNSDLGVASDAFAKTQIGQCVIRGGCGVDVEGYLNRRGERVVGAWCWLDDCQLGVAIEQPWGAAWRSWGRLGGKLRMASVGLLIAGLLAMVGLGRGPYPGLRRRSGQTGSRLGKYELLQAVGSGGMGTVYRGRHQMMFRPVAIKVLDAKIADEKSIERFQREVQLTSQLQHPNTVRVYDFGREAGTFYYVMEFIDGIDLAALIQHDGPQPPGRVVHVLRQVCGSLAEAHRQGLVHRDIKPGNILLSPSGGEYDFVKVVDFGLVKETTRVDAKAVTRKESLTGTPQFMSPEAIRDAAGVDARADIYAVCAVGYFMLTGRPLFDADSAIDICLKQISETPLRPAERMRQPLPVDLQDVLMSGLRKSRGERPQTAEALDQLLAGCAAAGAWSERAAEAWWSGWEATDTAEDRQQAAQRPAPIAVGDATVVD